MQRNYYYLITKKEERTRSFLSTASYKYMKLIKKNRAGIKRVNEKILSFIKFQTNDPAGLK